MRLRRLVRKLKLSLAGLVGGFAFACSGPNPGEMPPLAPRPEPVQPTPSNPRPVPGAPDPIKAIDAGAPIPITQVEIKPQSSPDAGVVDAAVLPDEVPDALPPDANKRPESTSFHCC